MLPADCQIVAFAHQRDKAEAKHARGGSRRDATIRLARLHLPSRGQMSRSNAIVSADILSIDFEAFQGRIEQCPAARAFFTIDDGDVATGQVLDGLDTFWIAGSGNNPFFPHRECDDGNGVLGKKPSNLWKVRFTARFIAQMGARDVDAPVLQQLERLRTIAMRENQLDARRLQMMSQY